jgi:hypothetical protein
MSPNALRSRDWLIAIGATAFAFFLRVLGVTFGLPWFHHWDEGWVTDNASHMLQSNDWEPRIYQYGAPLSLLIDLVLRSMSRLWSNSFFDPNDSALMHIIGRMTTVVISSTGAFATYIAARFVLAGDRNAVTRGAYAAFLYAGAAELVSHGRYSVTDACLAAFVAWSLAFSALYLRGGRFLWGACAVLAASLAVAFKVTAAVSLSIPFAALVLRRYGTSKKVWIGTLGVFAVAAVLVFFALNPHVLIHWKAASDDISVRINQYREGRVPEFVVREAGLDHLFAVVVAMFSQLLHRSSPVSMVAMTTSLVGLAFALRARSRLVVIGLLHAALVVGGLAFGSRAFLLRNYLVVCPLLSIGLGMALSSIQRRITRSLATAAFAAVFVIVPAAEAIRMHQLATDTRERAMNWIATHVNDRKPLIVALGTGYGVDSTGDRTDLHAAFERPHVILRDVQTSADVKQSRADFALVISQPDYYGRGEVWPFREVPGYRQVAEFEANPYEHNFDVTPTWMGRFSSLVLERQRE